MIMELAAVHVGKRCITPCHEDQRAKYSKDTKNRVTLQLTLKVRLQQFSFKNHKRFKSNAINIFFISKLMLLTTDK